MNRFAFALGLAACGSSQSAVQQPGGRADRAPLSGAAEARMVTVPAGNSVAGSTPEERAAAYDDYAATAGNDTARTQRWFEREDDRHTVTLPAFRIDLMPVTQAEFAEMVLDQRVAAPSIDEAGWRAERLPQDFASQVARYNWSDGRPPNGREDHPVVLVSWADADRYCAWRGTLRGEARRLPTANELEKASRGDSGLAYPWGNAFEARRLNSAVGGPGDTTQVGNYPSGASQYGVLDVAGNVMEWTATQAERSAADAPDSPDARDTSQLMVVKGSAWTDYGGFGRGAGLATQARSIRHVAIGFRCAGDAPAAD